MFVLVVLLCFGASFILSLLSEEKGGGNVVEEEAQPWARTGGARSHTRGGVTGLDTLLCLPSSLGSRLGRDSTTNLKWLCSHHVTFMLAQITHHHK